LTSKEAGQGTGLGRAIVYGIIYQSGGDIILTSRVGQGTCLKILLPAVEKPLSRARRSEEQSPVRGNETILLVEDEDSVRQLVRGFLTGLGYNLSYALWRARLSAGG
jgi:hypothetical protein